MSKGSLSLWGSNLPFMSICRNLKCWGVSKEPWVFQEMAHLKPDAEIEKKLSGKFWDTWLNKEIGFWNTLCWDTLSTNKKHELFFLTVPQLTCSSAHLASQIFYHDSRFEESVPCLLDMPFVSNLLHKDLFIQGRIYSYYWIFISNDLPLSLYHSYIIRNFLTLSLSLFSKDQLEYLIQPLAICIYACVSLPAAPNSQLLSTAGQLPNTSITEWSNSCLFPGPHKRDMTAPPIKENQSLETHVFNLGWFQNLWPFYYIAELVFPLADKNIENCSNSWNWRI